MLERIRTATAMAFRDQLRRPLVPILLVLVPLLVVVIAVAQTQATPRSIELPGGVWATTTMKALHGPEMAKFAVAFVAAIVGVFVMQASLRGDRRLVAAGYRRHEVIVARLLVLASATTVAITVAALVMSTGFTPASWPPVVGGLVLVGLIYVAIGALAGTILDKVAATYVILFVAMTDLGVVQTPMFHATPVHFAWLLPGYGPSRLLLEGAYSPAFNAGSDLALAVAWALALGAAAVLVLRRRLGTRRKPPQERQINFARSSPPPAMLGR